MKSKLGRACCLKLGKCFVQIVVRMCFEIVCTFACICFRRRRLVYILSAHARRNEPPVGFESTTSRLLSGCSAS